MKDAYGNEHSSANGQFVSKGEATPAEAKRLAEMGIGVENWTKQKRIAESELTGDNSQYKGEQTQIEYDKAVNPKIVDYIEKVKGGTKENFRIATPTDHEVYEIYKLTGIDTTGWARYITPDTVRHIEDRHGEHGKADQSMKDPKDIARIEYVLGNFDEINRGDKSTYAFRDSDKTPAQVLIYRKRINGNYFVAEAVPNAKSKSIYIQSTYKEKPRTG